MPQSEFVNFLLEQMQACASVQARRMFGGYGLYCDGLMFGLVAEDMLYLKVDAESAARFDSLALEAFSYRNKQGTRCIMSYRAAPAEALDDADLLCDWMRLGLQAARRAHSEKHR